MIKALIIVDIQNDFTTGGALAVPGGESIIDAVNAIQEKFALVVATQDWHPPGHKSFASSHSGKNQFEKIVLDGKDQVLWPDHCIQGSRGAELHPELRTNRLEAIFRKGMAINIDSYSGFYDNGHRKSTGLAGYLKERLVDEVYVCGLAADYCVYYTAKDSIKEGFKTFYIEDATRWIDHAGFIAAKKDIIESGGYLITTREIT